MKKPSNLIAQLGKHLLGQCNFELSKTGLLQLDGANTKPVKLEEGVRPNVVQYFSAKNTLEKYIKLSKKDTLLLYKRLHDFLVSELQDEILEDEKVKAVETSGGFDIGNIKLVELLGPFRHQFTSMRSHNKGLVCAYRDGGFLHPNQFSPDNLERIAPKYYKMCLAQIEMGTIVYAPDKPSVWQDEWESGDASIPDLTHYNSCRHPRWRGVDSDNTERLPEDLDAIFKHTFPDEKMYEYFLDWCAWAVQDKAEVYLVISGAPGIGKGVITRLLTALVGKHNVREASQKQLQSGFNDMLLDSRLVIHDEHPARKKTEISALKKNIEKQQSIQKKFADLGEVQTIWASMLITINKGIPYSFEPNERKFSVLDTTTKPLTQSYNRDEINDLVLKFENDVDYLAAIGHFFLNRKPTHSRIEPMLGKRFWELLVIGLNGFYSYLYEQLGRNHGREKNLLTMFSEYNKQNSKERPTIEGVKTWLEMWEEAGRPIARIYQREGKPYVKSSIKVGSSLPTLEDSEESFASTEESTSSSDGEFDLL